MRRPRDLGYNCGCMSTWLLPDRPFGTLDEYLAAGGGRALPLARERGSEWVLDELERAGLRGRGGAGFPLAAQMAVGARGRRGARRPLRGRERRRR